MKTLLLRLLESLEEIGEVHEELFDTVVRERMGEAIMEGFVREDKDYRIPAELGMYSDAANEVVRQTLRDYVKSANAKARLLGILKFHDRLAAFQDGSVVAKNIGNNYDEFFGHTPPEFYDEKGNVLRTQ